MTSGLATTSYLLDAATALREATELVFIEVSPWRVMAAGPDRIAGRIPGALATSIKFDFAGTPTATSGHLPLPAPGHLHAALRSRGVRPTDNVIVYTRRIEELSSATRAWFTLTWAGFSSVRVLDGALPAWTNVGGPTESLEATGPTELPPPAAGPTAPSSGRSVPGVDLPVPPSVRVLDAAEVLEISQYGTLLDARPAHAYNGLADDPRSGHIPHAVHAPSNHLVTPDGRLRPATELRRWFLQHRAIGAHEVGAYCGGGVSSSLLVFAAALLSQPIGLYVDSWSAWSATPALPVEQGTTPTPSPDLDTDCT
ncbi:thiosulfate/3-mercaptopyruvate sulfurtransferase [Kribbella aluminosa]|uniref:Thiosulfate/3-mercaptopyruvate sulfurtransferase n=1 Tax=Kribbella aluminosa TaxID=416017 RepID=A0ABS4UJ38_9ACTN|nr:rhodanese-like domain-containing protein [Kribbella aluminosa]MBP2351680.1 thiosulfate/3-mercaptopyruvate sulfurtransferase [Kribbella aluminosa]